MVEVGESRAAAILRGVTPLWTPGGVHELRVLNTKERTVSGYFDDPKRFADAAASWDRKAPGVYMTLNPVDPRLLGRANNHARARADHSTTDAYITARRFIPLDFDADRPAGISSSDDEHRAALARGRECCVWLLERGIPRDSILFGDSGNGAHVLIRCDLANDEAARDLAQRVLQGIASQFEYDGIKVDQSTFNASRIWKVPGSHACKGEDLPDYPHREAHWLQVPDSIAPAPLATLERIAAPVSIAPTPNQPRGPSFDLEGFIARYLAGTARDPQPYDGGTRWTLRVCPFNPEHTGTSAALFRLASGAIVFRCQHNACSDKSWSDVRRLFDAAYAPGTQALTPLAAPPTNGHGEPPTPRLPDDFPGFPLTDAGNAERFVYWYGRDALFCAVWNKWLLWDERRFAADTTRAVERWAIKTVRNIHLEAVNAPTDEQRVELAKHAYRSENEPKLRALVKIAGAQRPISPEALDQDALLFNCANGTVDLRTGELRPHARDDRLTKLSPVAYDPDARSPLWDAFLDRIMAGNQELIAFLQRFAGYLLTGLTIERVLVFFWGLGANGKTVLVNSLQHCLGDYAKGTRPETLMVKPGQSIPNDIAALVGARCVTTVEVDEGSRLAESLVKQLTGGDVVTARFLYGEDFNFLPTFKILMVGNTKPGVRGSDDAIWQRILTVPFDVRIPEDEQDRTLASRLQKEAPGVLAWMVEGCRQWQEMGLKPPEVVRTATRQYRDEMDVLEQFIEECCEKIHDRETSSRELYDRYAEWCKASGERQWSQQLFGRRLRDKGYTSDRDKQTRVWNGLRILPTVHDDT